MKVATWNVNSVRARLDRAVAWAERERPDVLCLQEIKVETELFPAERFRALGYHAAIHGQKTYNGVAILSLEPPAEVERGLLGEGEGAQARLIGATVRGVRILNAYVPNGHLVGSDKWAHKLQWLSGLRRHLDERASPERPLLLVGDLNVAPEARDVHDPAAFENDVLFHEDARAALAHVAAFGLVDAFRAARPEPGLFSWWDYRQLAFPKNLGARIDHVLATPPAAARVVAARIDRDERKGKQPSDHAPVLVELSA
ncbi:MAG: exodeoxyribonuclease III [Deltaproteobacteria bacterium]